MSDILKLLQKLEKKGIKLALENGKLSIDAPSGAITPELLEEIKLNKDLLISIVALTPGKTELQDIAIIGMSCRVAGADNKEEFWGNLINNVESIRDITDKELLLSGLSSKDIADPNYVKRGSFINNLEYFDAGFFGFTPLDAKSMDPQQRHFFECSWEALEDAGVSLSSCKSRVGVFSGRGYNVYLHDIVAKSDVYDRLGPYQVHTNNRYLSTSISYRFNLTGPSYDINTGCSTSLVAVNDAIKSLLFGESDIALAGGVTLSQISGYLYKEGMINSPDGHCRTFDAGASGTVFGSAVGVIVLKRLEDALADNDQVYAVIKGSAINNDGSLKVSFTAPSVEGQSNVITDAIEKAGVDPETISYIEAHGTATPLGDPIEISALTQAYRNFTDKKQYCAIGSVKTNIGHTDTASGIMGLIKTALALKHKKIPASLHFNKANPEINFENSPFFVNAELRDWEVPEGIPRRAGVSSFGIGGTNAHAILEEAPEREASSKSRKQQLFLLSAKTDTSVSAYANKLANLLKENKENKENKDDIKLADVAYTLQVGRDSLKHRRCYVAESFDQAIDVLGKKAVKSQIGEIAQEGATPDITFMFSGQGAQYVNMARGLYEQEPLFKELVDQCCDILKDKVELDLLEVLYPKDKADIKAATDKITQTNYAQPALFVIEYALAKLLMHWGIEPKSMIGHSIGEYIAATIAGVFDLKDALLLVATRGKLMHGMQSGSMLSVNLEEAKLKDLLPKDLVFAAVNSPSLCVVSGETKAIKDFQDKLDKKDISCTLLHTSHAFHSPMMQAAAEEFLKVVKKVKKGAPKIGFVSNLTGDMVTKQQAVSDQYWVDHLLNAVLFDKGVSKLLTDKLSCLVEIGPGRTLSTFALQNKSKSKSHHVLTSVRHPKDEMDDLAMLLNLVGRLWLAGVEIDYDAFYEKEKRNKISIPTYCFDHKRYWIEPSEKEVSPSLEGKVEIKPNMEDWFYEPSWKKANLPKKLTNFIRKDDNCLIFEDDFGVTESLAESLKDKFSNIIRVQVGDEFSSHNGNLFIINPNNKSDYIELLQALADKKIAIQHVVHAWSLSGYIKDITTDILASSNQLSFYSLLYLAQGLIEVMPQANLNINVLTNNIWVVLDEEVNPQMSTITGPIKVITKEHPELRCRHIDIMLDADKSVFKLSKEICSCLVDEIGSKVGNGFEREICYRDKQRWVRGLEPVKLEAISLSTNIKEEKSYFITGGLGAIGLSLAKSFAQKAKSKIALVSRKKLTDHSLWEGFIKDNPDDKQTFILKRLLEIENLGSEIMVCSADVIDSSSVKDITDQVIKKFGKVDVVIHAAGMPGGGIIDLKTPEMVEKVFAPKLQGTVILANLMQKIKPERIVFCSAGSAIYGEPSQIDYAGANAFLDSYSKYFEKLTGIKTVSINWLRWNEIGMAEETEVPDAMDEGRAQARLYGVSPEDGCELYDRIIASGLSQVITNKTDIELNVLNMEQGDISVSEEEVAEVEDVSDIKVIIANIWSEILGIEDLDYDDNFFDVGGHSLLATQLLSKMRSKFDVVLSIADVFQYPTITSFTDFIGEKLGILQKDGKAKKVSVRGKTELQDIAIIGISCRAADADNKEEFWGNLTNNVESIRDITDKELLLSGLTTKGDISDPNYVKRGSFINNLEYFDAGFFGYSPLDAKSMDPQIRHFFECSWEALEDAGVSLSNYKDRVGVFAGRSFNSYLDSNIRNSDIANTLGSFQVSINNAYLSTRLSYNLNLVGPSYDISTACSTSLVALHDAIRSLLFGESDIALAGGVSLSQISGYLYQDGMINSPDGRCRTFDADASGTVFGSAVGVVVLKRLDDAIADNDQVYAVIKGSAINNDGSLKVSFTAPSVEGQSNVIRDAIEKSGVDLETISYVEAHGTATPLGDPIEISALTQAYRNFTDKKQYCAIGSVKTNIGHTDAASGVMGLIKTALALKHKKIPASLHFNKPNPEIDFANSPFFVNTELKDWDVPEGTPRRAGVSSFGIGGTNAHAILEEAPEREASSESRKQQLLLLSAKTDTSVSAYADKLANFLKENKADIKLADVAYTLQVGRDSLKHRRCYIAESFDQAIDVLGKKAVKAQTGEILQEGVTPDIIFMFSGQGAQYVNMARGLYEQEPLFKEVVDQCCDILKREEKLDLLEVLYPENKADIKAATDKITQTNYAQPSLFVIEYALAKLLMHWGIEPKSMIGHSIGEYIAATIAGVFDLKDALLLVATRGKLMHAMQAGSMLSVNLEEAKLKDLLPKDLVFAAVNSPSLCVVSGESKAIKDFQDKLKKKDVSCTLLHTSHAFHSPMMQGAADEFLKVVKKVKKDAPKIGFISNLTGDMITKEQAMSDQYWVDHLLNVVLFDKGVSGLLTDKLSCLVEIGPGRTLSTFALQNKAKSKSHHVLTSVRHPKDEMDDLAMLLNLVGRLWLAGVEIDYDAFYEQEKRNKISIPTYCFDHKKYWIEAQKKTISEGEGSIEEFTPEEHIDLGPEEFDSNTVISKVKGMWRAVLGVDDLEEDDNFFELGGHSLLATQLIAELRSKFGLDFTVKFVFENPTLAEMAMKLELMLELKGDSDGDGDTENDKGEEDDDIIILD